MVTNDERLQRIFRDMFGDALVIHDDTTADDVEAWDSLAHVNLLFRIEREFRVRFAGDEAASLRNVGELRTLLSSKGVEGIGSVR